MNARDAFVHATKTICTVVSSHAALKKAGVGSRLLRTEPFEV